MSTPLTAAHLAPWDGNIVELTVAMDAEEPAHLVGLLRAIDDKWVRLIPARGKAALPDGGRVEIIRTTAVVRAARN